jgi:hypothetical protein
MIVARLLFCVLTSLGASLLMQLCEFGETLIHGMGSNDHSKGGGKLPLQKTDL